MNPTLLDEIEDISLSQDAGVNEIEKKRSVRNHKSQVIQIKNGSIDYNSLVSLQDGEVNITYNGIPFSCLLRVGNADFMYVFTSSGRTNSRYPIYVRNSYSNLVADTILCIDDPSYLYNKKLTNGWYIGDKENDFQLYVSKIVEKIANILSIPLTKVIFYGSSSGGTAAIHMSSILKGSNFISINPQILPSKYYWTGNYPFESGYQLDEFGVRTDTLYHLKAAISGIIIYNIADPVDFKILLNLVKVLGLRLHEGLNKLSDKKYIWVYTAFGIPGGMRAHGNQETKTLFFAIDFLIKNMVYNKPIDEYYYLFGILTETWHDFYESKSNAQLDFVKKMLDSNQDSVAYAILKNHRDNPYALSMYKQFYERFNKFRITERDIVADQSVTKTNVLRNSTHICDTYPIDATLIEKLNYYGNLSKSYLDFEFVPNYIPLRKSKKKLLVIISFNNGLLNALLRYFPLAYFDLIGWCDNGRYISYLGNSLEEDLPRADKFFIVGDFNELNALSGWNNKYFFKNIAYEKADSVDSLDAYKFRFGTHNPNKKFIVWVPNITNGLLLHMTNFISYSKSVQGYEFYVDMQNYINQHVAPRDLGRYNAWEVYFKQLTSVPIDEIYQSSEVYCATRPTKYNIINLSNNDLSEHILSVTEKLDKEMFSKNTKTISVFLRGTGYIRFPWHVIPYDPYEAVEVAKKYMSHYNADKIFLNTEDQHNFEVFSEKFGNKLIAMRRKRYYKGEFVESVVPTGHSFKSLTMGQDYLVETLLTTNSMGVITGPGAATTIIKEYCKEKNIFCDEILVKNREGLCGATPIVIESHNKNHFDVNSCILNVSGLKKEIIGSKIHVVGTVLHKNSEIVVEDCPIFLKRATSYCISLGADVKSAKVILKGKSGKLHTQSISDRILTSEEICSIGISIDFEPGFVDINLCIQIEEGFFSTEYEPYQYSETDIAIRDQNGLLYKYEYLNGLNLENGYIDIGGVKKKLHYVDYLAINKIIHYENGYLRCRHRDEYLDDLSQIHTSVATTLYDMVDLYLSTIPADKGNYPAICSAYCSYLTSGDQKLIDYGLAGLLNIKTVPYAKEVLFKAYSSGWGVKPDLDLAKTYIEELVNVDGWAHKKREYDQFLQRYHTECIKKVEFDNLLKSAKGGEVSAMLSLYDYYSLGQKIPKDLDKAICWMRKAFNQDHSFLEKFIQSLLGTGQIRYYQEAKKICELNISLNESVCTYYLGKISQFGYGIEVNIGSAIQQYKRSVNLGNPKALSELHNLLISSGDTSELESYISFLTSLAETGSAEAMARIGIAYRDGIIFDKNITCAIQWFKKSIKYGYGWGNILLFDALWSLNDADADEEAFSIISTYANTGKADAVYRLSKAYEFGRGTTKDLKKAENYLKIASEKGLPAAVKEYTKKQSKPL